ncbi:hypothetical protein R3P38DRAFT_1148310 [Favolaschia claudopus]|uniref:Secreted protein n=1 Tax=Favolaschia claudopus TaxID=2862362 RepID=A0AAW0B5R9_9AGAR
MGNILPSVHSRRHSLLAIWMIVFGTAIPSTFNWPQHSRPWQREKPHHQLDCAVNSIAPPGFEFASVCTLKTSYRPHTYGRSCKHWQCTFSCLNSV